MMRYYRNMNENIVVSINTVDADGAGNITVEEYTAIRLLLRAKPDGKLLSYDGTEYSYIDSPEQYTEIDGGE